jgi:UDP-glucose 4-epimerase
LRELLEHTDAARIVVLDNFFNSCREYIPEVSRVVSRQVDLTNGEAIEEVLQETHPEVVFHLAALHFIPYCNAHPAETLQVNVVGTQNLLEACRRYPPARLVAASTAAVYPICDGPNSEDDPAGPTDVYGLSKWINEQQLVLFAQQTSTRCAAARLFNVFGPNETNPHVIPEILDQVVKGVDEIALGNVKPKRDYIYTSDVARALHVIAQKNEHAFRVYNVGTGKEYSVEEILEHLAAITGRRLRIAVAADRVRKSDRMHLLCDPARMAEELGWKAEHTLESGLIDLWRSVSKKATRGVLESICS